MDQTTTKKKSNQHPHGRAIKRGDVYYADLSLNKGSEQSGIRPVIVIQNDIGNQYSPTVIVACVTSSYSTSKLATQVEVGINEGMDKPSVILCEQIRTIDKTRLLLHRKITVLDEIIMERVDEALRISLGLMEI